jgi:hypothetical protein
MFHKKTLLVPIAVIFIGLLSMPAAKAQATPPDPAIRTGGAAVRLPSPRQTSSLCRRRETVQLRVTAL